MGFISPPAIQEYDAREDFQRARSLVLEFGHNPTAYQVLNPGISLWFSRAGEGVVGYVDRPGVRVVAGNPIAPLAELAAVAAEFEQTTRASNRKVVYLAADQALADIYQGREGYASIVVGAQPVVDPSTWGEEVRGHASLRAQFHRAKNKGVTVQAWDSERATNNQALENCREEWLGRKGLPPLHFLVEPDTLGLLDDRKVFVAEHGGAVVGFVVLSPIPLRHGWQIEQLVRGAGAPNGTTELLVDAAVRWCGEKEVHYVALGAAPLSHRAGRVAETPRMVEAILDWQRAHARRFYNFEGLEAFKAKFHPTGWEPVYAISTEPNFSIGSLYAIAGAYCGESPVGTIARAMVRAAGQEMRWGWDRLTARKE